MDGASKFVRGDATAEHPDPADQHDRRRRDRHAWRTGCDFAEAARVYALLTIGDGLVAQIPALLLSTAVAVIVTRMSRDQDMGGEVAAKLFGDPRLLAVAAGVIGSLGLIPGMPNVAFLGMAALCGGGAWWTWKRRQAARGRRRANRRRRCRCRRPSRANCRGTTCARST